MFQPTRPHGARLVVVQPVKAESSFNPRARMGRDVDDAICRYPLRVSTHAPAWGATHAPINAMSTVMFQPTRPHGARHNSINGETSASRFQPTRPHGARRQCFLNRLDDFFVSTHAPAWGATLRDCAHLSKHRFQPTRPHGARQTFIMSIWCLYMFQPTRPHGARQSSQGLIQ